MPFSGTQQDRAAERAPSRFQEALARLRAVVGSEHVHTGQEAVSRYSRDTIPWQRTCSAIVFPGHTEEVRSVVRTAGEFNLAVWPFSKGKNWGYGGTMACHDGAVILVLERLNRILEVNEQLAYAVIEPGVTQKQLNDFLKENRIKLWTDCTDSTPQGSILGNALERGLGYTPYGDHFGHLCGLEVVLPNGDLVRTGAGPEDLRTWNTYKWGTGPYLEGLFSQSNCGIVTKAGIWLMPEPEDFNCYILNVEKDTNLPAVVDAVRRLALQGAVQSNVHMVNDFSFMTLFLQYPYELCQGQTYLGESERAALRRKYHVSPWTLTGGLYGSAGQVRANRTLVRRGLSPFGKLVFLNDRKLARLRWLIGFLRKTSHIPVVASLGCLLKNCLVSRMPLDVLELFPKVYPIFKGIPGEFVVSCAYLKSRKPRPTADVDEARDGCGLITFAPVVPLTGKHIQEIIDICRPTFEKHGFDFCMSMILVNARSAATVMTIFYQREDADEASRAADLYDALTEQTIQAGYQQYRTSVACMDRVLRVAPGYRDLAETIKTALDPNNILAPGRYGLGFPRTAGSGQQ